MITVTMKSGAKASCKITVKKGQVKTTKVTVASKSISVKKGKTYQIIPRRTPVTANDKLTYTVKSGSKKVQITVKVK